MVYLLVVIGLVLIYFSLKSSKPSTNRSNFSTVLQKSLENSEFENITQQLKDFSDRIDNIEASLLLMHEELNKNNEIEDIYKADENSYNIEQTADEMKTILETKPFESIVTDSQTSINNTLNNNLYQLFDEGKTIDEISSITRIGKGEILLRLGLRKQQS